VTVVPPSQRPRPQGRLPQPEHAPRRARDVTAGLAAAAALLGLLAGVPFLLVRFVGWPLPTTAPSAAWLTAPLDADTLLNVMAVLVWLAWAHFAVCVVVEWRHERRGMGMPVRVPLGGGSQALARRLVAAVLVLLGGVMAVAPASAATLEPRAAVSASSSAVAGTAAPAPARADGVQGASRADGFAAGAAVADAARGIATAQASAGLTLYEVRPPDGRHHDCLWDIAERYLGEGRRYKELVQLNRGRVQPDGRALHDPDLIQPGWVLVMPADARGPGLTVIDPVLAGGPPLSRAGGPSADPRTVPEPPGEERVAGAVTGVADATADAAAGAAASGAGAVAPGVGIGIQAGPGLGVAAAALAAGLLAALRRRRGPYAGSEGDDDADAELALRLAADEPTARRVDAALRDLALRLADAGRELPVVYAGWLGVQGSPSGAHPTGDLTLALSPAVPQAPAPWVADAGGRTWTLPASTPVDAGPTGPAGISGAAAPYPGLVTVGRRPSDGALTLLDLEAAPGVVSLGGHLETARHAAASIAVELGTNLWSDGLQVTLVGFGDDLTALAPDRLRRVDDLDQVLDDVESRTAVQASACTQTGLASVLRGRQVRPGPIWSPQFLVLSAPPTAEQVRRLALLADDRRRAVGVLVVGDVPAARWRAVLDADGTLRAPVLGLEVQAQLLPPAAYGPLVRMFRTASSSSRGDALDRALSGLSGVSGAGGDGAQAGDPDAVPVLGRHLDPMATAPVEVRVMGPVEVVAPGPLGAGRRDLAQELVVAVALHPQGLHPRVLASYLWPRGAGEDVQAGMVAEVQQWLGSGPDGRPRLQRDGEGRWRLAADVRVDLHVVAALVARARAAQHSPTVDRRADEAGDLAAALSFVRGEGWSGLPAGRYAWLARSPAERISRRLVVAAAARLADLATDRGHLDLAEEALHTGLRMVPVAEELWRALLSLHHAAGGPAGAAPVAEEMYAVLARHDVPGGAQAQTDALVEALVPGHRRRTA